MAFVYRYLRPQSGEVLYIGKTSGDSISSLSARISAHANEDKFKKHKPRKGYVIEYVGGLSASDADILETALINEHLSPPPLNKGKTLWGKSGLVHVDDLQWRTWQNESASREYVARRFHDADDGHEDAVYICDRCGKYERIGRYHGPRYCELNCLSKSSHILSGIWLCNECSEIMTDALCRIIDGARTAGAMGWPAEMKEVAP